MFTLFGEDFQFDSYFSDGLKPITRYTIMSKLKLSVGISERNKNVSRPPGGDDPTSWVGGRSNCCFFRVDVSVGYILPPRMLDCHHQDDMKYFLGNLNLNLHLPRASILGGRGDTGEVGLYGNGKVSEI